MRQTHTYAIVEISAAAYAEIRAKLVEANYDHLISSDGTSEVIDMNGLAVAGKVTASVTLDGETVVCLRRFDPVLKQTVFTPLPAPVTPEPPTSRRKCERCGVEEGVNTPCIGRIGVHSWPAQAAEPLPFIRVESTNVWAYAYTPDDLTLHVQFKSGGSYRYSPATAEDIRQFVETPSKGGFIAQFKNRPGITVMFVENWKAVLELAARS